MTYEHGCRARVKTAQKEFSFMKKAVDGWVAALLLFGRAREEKGGGEGKKFLFWR